MTFDYKGYGRIFVEKEEDIQKVKDKIKELDDFEYGYLPVDLIRVWRGDLDDITYCYKFDELDIDNLCSELFNEGVNCAWVKGESKDCDNHFTLTDMQAFFMYEAGFMSKHDILEEFGLEFLEDE